MKERGPIFYDAERVRWRRTRRVLEIIAILLTISLAYFFITIAVSVDLPAGLLPDTKPAFRPLKFKPGQVLPVREGRQAGASPILERCLPAMIRCERRFLSAGIPAAWPR